MPPTPTDKVPKYSGVTKDGFFIQSDNLRDFALGNLQSFCITETMTEEEVIKHFDRDYKLPKDFPTPTNGERRPQYIDKDYVRSINRHHPVPAQGVEYSRNDKGEVEIDGLTFKHYDVPARDESETKELESILNGDYEGGMPLTWATRDLIMGFFHSSRVTLLSQIEAEVGMIDVAQFTYGTERDLVGLRWAVLDIIRSYRK